MHKRKIAFSAGSALCAVLFAIAFVAAPHSCEWGLSAYFWSGVVVVLVLFALPLVFHAAASTRARIGLAFGFAAVGCGVWFGGLFAANFQIMCRLF